MNGLVKKTLFDDLANHLKCLLKEFCRNNIHKSNILLSNLMSTFEKKLN